MPLEPLIRARLKRVHTYGLEIDDIIQEMYARIASLSAPEDIRYPKQYALQTATAIIIDHVRHSRVISINSGGSLEQLEIASPDAGPDLRLEFREEIAEIALFLSRLPATTRETLILRRVEGLSQQETAARLGVSVKTVEKHMARGTLLLMELFGRGGKSRIRSSNGTKQDLPDDDEAIRPGD